MTEELAKTAENLDQIGNLYQKINELQWEINIDERVEAQSRVGGGYVEQAYVTVPKPVMKVEEPDAKTYIGKVGLKGVIVRLIVSVLAGIILVSFQYKPLFILAMPCFIYAYWHGIRFIVVLIRTKKYEAALQKYQADRSRYEAELSTYAERAKAADSQNARIREENEKQKKEYDEKIQRAILEIREEKSTKKKWLEDCQHLLDSYQGIIPEKFYPHAKELAQIIRDYRADSVKEAINIFIADANAQQWQAEQRQYNEEMRRMELEHERAQQEREWAQQERDRERADREARDRAASDEMHRKKMEELTLCGNCSNYLYCCHKGRASGDCHKYR